jgi:hypothetical protein
LQAVAGPMGCEPRGFGWSATVEVCSVRVTRLVTGREKSKKFRALNWCLAPGRGADLLASWPVAAGAWHQSRERDLPAFRLGDRKGCLAPGRGADLLASWPVAAGAWHQSRERDLPADSGIAKGAWHEWHCKPGVRAQVL